MLQKLIWWFKGTTLYCNWKYEQYDPTGQNMEKWRKILDAQTPNQFFRIGWLILFTNKSKKVAWIYLNTREETNNG